MTMVNAIRTTITLVMLIGLGAGKPPSLRSSSRTDGRTLGRPGRRLWTKGHFLQQHVFEVFDHIAQCALVAFPLDAVLDEIGYDFDQLLRGSVGILVRCLPGGCVLEIE